MDNLTTLTEKILKHAFKVHSGLGPGLLESAYKECLYYELTQNGIYAEKEKAMPLYYEEIKMDTGYRVDLIVENKIILEIKCVECFNDVHIAQILTYLKLSVVKSGYYSTLKQQV